MRAFCKCGHVAIPYKLEIISHITIDCGCTRGKTVVDYLQPHKNERLTLLSLTDGRWPHSSPEFALLTALCCQLYIRTKMVPFSYYH